MNDINKNDKLLDIGVSYTNDLNFMPDEEDIPPRPQIDIDNEKKKYEREQEILLINNINDSISRLLDVKFDLNSNKNQIECQNFINDTSSLLFRGLDRNIFNTYSKMLSDLRLINEIKDKKFQAYYKARNGFNDLIKKLGETKMTSKDYLITSIRSMMNKLDQYLITYINNLMYHANKDNILRYVKNMYKKKMNK